MSMLVLGSASFAQNKDAKKPAKKEAKPVKTETPVQQPTPSTAPPPKVGKGKTKKDGTPDMRLKENKEAAKPTAGPLKKDGTPDMRYKANKEAAKKK